MTAVTQDGSAAQSERRFFLIMAGVIAATVVIGFGLSALRLGAQYSAAPLHVHVHGMVFASWVAFYLAQNFLVVRGSADTHRKLGVLGLVILAAMLAVGTLTTVMALKLHRVPPFFTPAVFLVLDLATLAIFATLMIAALVRRADPAWHKRLMLSATILVISPALGRIVPMPLLGPWGTYVLTAVLLAYLAAAVAYDRRTRGAIHPAYGWGAAGIVLCQVLVAVLGAAPPVVALAARLQG